MSENSKIQWCHHTFNGWEGCTKVSEGCVFCYAENRNIRFADGANWGKGKPRRRTSAANWKLPLKWNRLAANAVFAWDTFRDKIGTTDEKLKAGGYSHPGRPRVFCASLADWLDDEVPIEWLADLLKLIHDTPNLDWLLLTKRPELFRRRLHMAAHQKSELACRWHMLDEVPANVWIGTSVENQKRADERIPELLQIPARVRFLSVEPMLGPVHDLFRIRQDGFRGGQPSMTGLHWAIFGGESGPGARPCSIEWISDGVKQCRAAGVAPFVKQLGADVRCDNANCYDWPDDAQLESAGQAFAACRVRLQDSKGGDMSEWPEDLRVREFPEVAL